jgi:tRNA-modifying protein YgfZ
LSPVDPSTLPGYETTLTRAGYFPLTDAGYLRISGPDRVSFLQRQSTNDVSQLSEGQALVTVLTSPTAKILDVLTLLPDGESIGAITLPGHPGATDQFLRGRIFFMDKVTVEDASAEFLQLELHGPAAKSVLQEAGFAGSFEPGQVLSGELGGLDVQAIRLSESEFRLLVPAPEGSRAIAVLERAGVDRLSPESREVLRVEVGRPGAGRELQEEYTPLEAGLEKAISDNKGCYTGQEIIARQITYDKVTRKLVGLVLEGEAAPGDSLWSPEEERNAGMVTSAANSPRFGPIALAILRRPYHEAGTELLAGEKEAGVRAKVVELPFQHGW